MKDTRSPSVVLALFSWFLRWRSVAFRLQSIVKRLTHIFFVSGWGHTRLHGNSRAG